MNSYIASVQDLLDTIKSGPLSPLYDILTNEEVVIHDYESLTKRELVEKLEEKDEMIRKAGNIICTILCYFVDAIDGLISEDDET